MLVPLPLRSSDPIAAATYEAFEGRLTVTFVNGRTYAYASVPRHVIAGLVAAAEPGAYYVENIKGQYA
jgi:hypothetical protein